MQQSAIVPFGKHKGKPIEALAQDRQYTDWLMSQDWFRSRYGSLYQIIVNNFGEPSETPEHNRIQVRFLDNEFCLRLIRLLEPTLFNGKWVERRRAEILANFLNRTLEPAIQDEAEFRKRAERAGEGSWVVDRHRESVAALSRATAKHDKIKAPLPAGALKLTGLKQTFEVGGWDIILSARFEAEQLPYESPATIRYGIEVKPCLGDDFPAVLRQIKAHGQVGYGCTVAVRSILLVDSFAAEGASIEQVSQFFARSEIDLVTLDRLA